MSTLVTRLKGTITAKSALLEKQINKTDDISRRHHNARRTINPKP
jgi:hypothetical protein